MENESNEKIINNNSINSSISNSSSSGGNSDDENNLYDDYQGPFTYPSEDIINQEIQLKDNNIIKIIQMATEVDSNKRASMTEIKNIMEKCNIK